MFRSNTFGTRLVPPAPREPRVVSTGVLCPLCGKEGLQLSDEGGSWDVIYCHDNPQQGGCGYMRKIPESLGDEFARVPGGEATARFKVMAALVRRACPDYHNPKPHEPRWG